MESFLHFTYQYFALVKPHFTNQARKKTCRRFTCLHETEICLKAMKEFQFGQLRKIQYQMLFKIPVWSSDLSGWQVAWKRHGWDNNKTIRWQWINPLPLVFMYHLCWSVWLGGETIWFRIFHVERCHSFVDSSADWLQGIVTLAPWKTCTEYQKGNAYYNPLNQDTQTGPLTFSTSCILGTFQKCLSIAQQNDQPPFFFKDPVNHPVWWLKITKLVFPGLEPTEALKPLEYLYPMSYSLSLVAWGKRSPTSGPTVVSVW